MSSMLPEIFFFHWQQSLGEVISQDDEEIFLCNSWMGRVINRDRNSCQSFNALADETRMMKKGPWDKKKGQIFLPKNNKNCKTNQAPADEVDYCYSLWAELLGILEEELYQFFPNCQLNRLKN